MRRGHERPSRRGQEPTTPVATWAAGQKLYYHAILLAENDIGYQQPDPDLEPKAFLEGYHYKPRADWET